MMLDAVRRRLQIAAMAIMCLCLLHVVALGSEVLYPLGSRIGLKPPPGMTLSKMFPGFEDADKNVFIRLVAMPGQTFSEIEKTMTKDALKQQGINVERYETVTLPSGKGLLVVARQQANDIQFHKWMLIAPFEGLTALVSFEIRDDVKDAYPEPVIRAALTSTTVRPTVPTSEQLELIPFQVGDLAGLRVVRVLPGVALQLTDGPKDTFDAVDQPHLVISIAAGSPPDPRDRDSFARMVLSSGLPPLKEVRITSSEPMRISGQQGHEMRATGKDPATGAEIMLVQWLRFGSSGFLRIIGFGPKENWTKNFMRFRAVRDSVGPK